MARHPKKQRLEPSASHKAARKTGSHPGNSTLAKLLDEESKDDEERKLESMLFGVPYAPPGSTAGGPVFNVDDEDEYGGHDDENESGGRPMAGLLDSDLFFIDDGPGRTSPGLLPIPDPSSGSGSETDCHGELAEKVYESRLRSQFERINPEPLWARRARKRNREEPEFQEYAGEDEEEGAVASASSLGDRFNGDKQNLFTSTSGILKAAKRRRKGVVTLPSGTLSIERLRDVNLSTQDTASGEVKVVAFHPSDRVPLLCVGTADRRIRLYNVDGHTSPLLKTLHVPSLPLISPTSALFHPSGSSILFSGPRPYFFTHDLQAGATTKHERGLWGTTFTSNHTFLDIGRQRPRVARGDGAESIHMTSFSPAGDVLAVAAGKGAQVHLVDWKSGAGQVIGSVKCALGSGTISGLWWFDGSSTPDDTILRAKTHLAVLTSDSEVYLWDVGERKCVRRWKDEGGYKGTGRALAGTQATSAYLALGSSSGFVNVYNPDSYSLHPSETFKAPKPIKMIGNLTTAISSLKFNHDAQLLAIASKEKKDSMRLIHVPTLTSFSNWPTQSTPLGVVTALDFSPKSEYIAIGNRRGRVLLYHLRDYGASI